MEKPAIYLDANAGAHLHREVSEALRQLLLESGILGSNPSSQHSHGRRAKRYLTEARDRVAASLGASPDDLIFTSSGTEANQLAIRSVLEPLDRPHWITTPVEHECNLKMQQWLRERGGEVSLLPVDASGAPIVSELSNLIRPNTALVTSIWVNNETGVITDVERLAAECRRHDIPLHLDGAQAWGKVPVDLRALGVAYAAFAAHKIGGLSGTGLLYLKSGAPLVAQMKGKQERGRRGGTENVLGIVAAGAAAARIDIESLREVASLRDWLEKTIRQRIPAVLVNGEGAPRVAGTLNLCFEGVEKDGVVEALDLEGFSVSSGAACSSGIVEPSHVLLALGRSPGLAGAGIRISLPRDATRPDLERFVQSLEKVVSRLRQHSGKSNTHAHATAAVLH